MDQLAQNFHVRTEVAEANVKLFADASLMRSYALTEDEEARYALMLPSLLKLFASYLRAYPDYYEIRFLLPDGFEDVRATLTPIPNATVEEGDTFFFKALSRSEDETLSRVFTNPDNGEIALQAARPLYLIDIANDDPLGTGPRLRGYLVITMKLDSIAEQIAENHIGKRGHILVTDKKGKILFHHDPSQVGETLPATLMKTAWNTSTEKQPHRASYQGEPALLASQALHKNLLLMGVLPASELLEESWRLGKTVAWIILGTVTL
ncbi:cache domain-containing protein [Pistricoccus aurantiacus]|nr:cache domain-containing protein [Pistricoccus aurantiacus]